MMNEVFGHSYERTFMNGNEICSKHKVRGTARANETGAKIFARCGFSSSAIVFLRAKHAGTVVLHILISRIFLTKVL